MHAHIIYGVERFAGAAGLLNKEWFDIRLVNPETEKKLKLVRSESW